MLPLEKTTPDSSKIQEPESITNDFKLIGKSDEGVTSCCSSTLEEIGDLKVGSDLKAFVEEIILASKQPFPITVDEFWKQLSEAIKNFRPEVLALLKTRDELQLKLSNLSEDPDVISELRKTSVLRDLTIVEPDLPPATCSTDMHSVDYEIAKTPAPQLVVPLTNARYSLNAANSRWMSLYDCLYVSNMFDEVEGSERAKECVEFTMDKLQSWIPLDGGSWSDSQTRNIRVEEGEFYVGSCKLKDPLSFVGHHEEEDGVNYYFIHNELHISVVVNPKTVLGEIHPLNISNVSLESALTVILDGEDSVAAVDEEDKILLYRNWHDILKGTLSVTFEKHGREVTRQLAPDRHYIDAEFGIKKHLVGRALLLLRVVGLFIPTSIVQYEDKPVPETILDIFIYGLIGHLLRKATPKPNSRHNSIYFVVPKLHGSEEVKLVVRLFEAAERAIAAPEGTFKIGIMDEERRTSLNLMNCLKCAKERVIFINTGFLDRTGDEIHTLSFLGVMPPKDSMKSAHWFKTYENRNVAAGLNFGLLSNAQIGKGMWPAPDALKELYQEKVNHVKTGASTAWVPSPTGACIHAMHYHDIDVFEVMRNKEKDFDMMALIENFEGLLHEELIPTDTLNNMIEQHKNSIQSMNNDLVGLCQAAYQDHMNGNTTDLTKDTILTEVLNNVQCIVGYTARWIILGIGCSKIPNMKGLGLMEDRATLRISSAMLSNWLKHRIIDQNLVIAAIKVVAMATDQSNQTEPGWVNIGSFDDERKSPALRAITNLCLFGDLTSRNYTEQTLYPFRRMMKNILSKRVMLS